LHGRHLPSAADTLYVSAICEGVHRFTAKRGAAVNLALPPLMYGGHPYHHVGMPGSIIVREHVVREMMIDVMLGLWNDGFRKQLIVNNHGQLWMLESAIQEFQKRQISRPVQQAQSLVGRRGSFCHRDRRHTRRCGWQG
jgi:creatinine amidohydrolase/Fe(II)-dependent formamide hydrolase-like protein